MSDVPKIPLHLLQAKAFGYVVAIEKLSKDERRYPPSPAFAGDYDNLRKQVINALPEIEAIAPPTATTYWNPDTESRHTETTFAEFLVYCSQFNEMLQAQNRQGAGK